MLLVSNDHSGKLVIAHWELKKEKKSEPTDLIFSVLNDHSGKLVIAHWELKLEKKLYHTVVNQLANLNDHDGKLVGKQDAQQAELSFINRIGKQADGALGRPRRTDVFAETRHRKIMLQPVP